MKITEKTKNDRVVTLPYVDDAAEFAGKISPDLVAFLEKQPIRESWFGRGKTFHRVGHDALEFASYIVNEVAKTYVVYDDATPAGLVLVERECYSPLSFKRDENKVFHGVENHGFERLTETQVLDVSVLPFTGKVDGYLLDETLALLRRDYSEYNVMLVTEHGTPVDKFFSAKGLGERHDERGRVEFRFQAGALVA